MKVGGAKWKTLTPEQKKPFEQQADDDKKRYEDDLAKVLAACVSKLKTYPDMLVL